MVQDRFVNLRISFRGGWLSISNALLCLNVLVENSPIFKSNIEYIIGIGRNNKYLSFVGKLHINIRQGLLTK
jgi:hypothetical protein